MTWPLAALGFSYMMITEAKSAFKRIRYVLEGEKTSFEPPQQDHNIVELEDVSFSYPDNSLHIKNLNLELKAQESYLVTGLTKSGKSTLIKLFAGMQNPKSGDLKIDDENAVYNPQTPFLFMNSLKENLLTSSNSKLTQGDFESVSFLEELQSLEEKEETRIGEKGANLSGGQKQRLSLLRAIKSDKSTLILDEPISAVDELTKVHIVKTLKELAQSKALVISSSNPEHFTWMDNVILIEEKAYEERLVQIIPMSEALNTEAFTSLLYKKKDDEVNVNV